MRDLIVALIAFGALPYVLVRPHVGILLWSWISYMNPHKLAWGWAQNLPLAQVAGITTILAMLMSSEKKRLPMTGTTLIWLCLIALCTATTFFAFIRTKRGFSGRSSSRSRSSRC